MLNLDLSPYFGKLLESFHYLKNEKRWTRSTKVSKRVVYFSTPSPPVAGANQSVLNAVFNLPSLSNFRNLTQLRNQTQAATQKVRATVNPSSETISNEQRPDATSNLLSNISRLIAKDPDTEKNKASEQTGKGELGVKLKYLKI